MSAASPARTARRLRDSGLVMFVVLAALAAATVLWLRRDRAERSYALTLAVGDPNGIRPRLAEILRDEARPRHLDLRLLSTPGSITAIERLEAGACQAALVQGGLVLPDHELIREVAPLHVEPLHLLVKGEKAEEAAANLQALIGASVNLGDGGSGTARLAREVLRFAGLADDAYRATDHPYADLMAATDAASLPDAVFTVSTLPSPVARRLVSAHGYRIVPLPFGEAFALGALDGPGDEIDRSHVFDATIPAYLYGIDPDVPEQEVHTLGARLLLVARADAPAEAVRRLLESLSSAEFARIEPQPLDARLQTLAPELPRHAGTELFLRRNLPLVGAELKEDLEKAVTIGGAALTALLVLGQWLYRRYARTRDDTFENYILHVAAIERRGQELELAPVPDLSALLRLQRDLGGLKARALDKFMANELNGAELLSSFLTHTSDARDYLTRLILQRREAIEKQARRDKRAPEDAWREALARSFGDDFGADVPTLADDAPSR